MSDHEQPSPGGTNWYLGLDKLFTPSLELLGNRLRHGLKKYLDSKARERKQLAQAERAFLERHVVILRFSHQQLETMMGAIEERY